MHLNWNQAAIAPLGESVSNSELFRRLAGAMGYTEAELPKFHADVARLIDKLFATEPFKSRKKDFNVRAIDLPAAKNEATIEPPLVPAR